jgi:hypothetical protein
MANARERTSIDTTKHIMLVVDGPYHHRNLMNRDGPVCRHLPLRRICPLARTYALPNCYKADSFSIFFVL